MALVIIVLLLLSGCAAMPDSIEPELVHVSHATQHIGSNRTEFGYNEVAIAAKWRPTVHFTIEMSEGYNVNRQWHSPYGSQYGSLIGPREVFELRAGWEIPIK